MSDKVKRGSAELLMDYYFKEYVRLTEQKKTATQSSTSTAGFSLVFQSGMFLFHIESGNAFPLILAHLVVMSLLCYISYLQNNIDAIHLSLSEIENRFNSLAGEKILNWSHKTMKKDEYNIHSSFILTVILTVMVECILLVYTVTALWGIDKFILYLIVMGVFAFASIYALKNMVLRKSE